MPRLVSIKSASAATCTIHFRIPSTKFDYIQTVSAKKCIFTKQFILPYRALLAQQLGLSLWGLDNIISCWARRCQSYSLHISIFALFSLCFPMISMVDSTADFMGAASVHLTALRPWAHVAFHNNYILFSTFHVHHTDIIRKRYDTQSILNRNCRAMLTCRCLTFKVNSPKKIYSLKTKNCSCPTLWPHRANQNWCMHTVEVRDLPASSVVAAILLLRLGCR